MSAYVVIPGFPMLFEFPDDGVDEVTDVFRDLISSGVPATFHLNIGGEAAEMNVLVNFRNITVATITAADPEVDAQGVRDESDRMRFTTSLDDIERRA